LISYSFIYIYRDNENHDKNDEEIILERDFITSKGQSEKRDSENKNNNFNKNFNSNNLNNNNYLVNSFINNTQQSIENVNSFGGINQTFQTFKSELNLLFLNI